MKGAGIYQFSDMEVECEYDRPLNIIIPYVDIPMPSPLNGIVGEGQIVLDIIGDCACHIFGVCIAPLLAHHHSRPCAVHKFGFDIEGAG